MSNVCIYITGYEAHIQVTRVIDGGEPSDFKSLFRNWRDKDATATMTYSRRSDIERYNIIDIISYHYITFSRILIFFISFFNG
jgi:hypothetical protein